MNNREAMQEAFEAFMANDEKFPDGCNMTERVFNAGYLASQAQQSESQPALKVVNGEICYQSTDDDQCYGMWCPVVYDTVHNFAEGTKFFALPPAPEGGDK